MSKRKAAEDTAMGKTQMDVDGEDSSDDVGSTLQRHTVNAYT